MTSLAPAFDLGGLFKQADAGAFGKSDDFEMGDGNNLEEMQVAPSLSLFLTSMQS